MNEIAISGNPAFSAASAAIGNISAAAALFVTTLEIRNVAKYTAVNRPTVPVPDDSARLTSVVATALATPEFCSALRLIKERVSIES
jgi:hypothetical protein